jgi:hypothetical protein
MHQQWQDCSANAHLLLPPSLGTNLSESPAQDIGSRLRLHLTIVDLFHRPRRQVLIWAVQMFRCGKPADLSKILGLSTRAGESHRVPRIPRAYECFCLVIEQTRAANLTNTVKGHYTFLCLGIWPGHPPHLPTFRASRNVARTLSAAQQGKGQRSIL